MPKNTYSKRVVFERKSAANAAVDVIANVTVENGKAIVEPLSGTGSSGKIGHTINQYFYTQTATPSQVYNASRKAMNDASVAVAF